MPRTRVVGRGRVTPAMRTRGNATATDPHARCVRGEVYLVLTTALPSSPHPRLALGRNPAQGRALPRQKTVLSGSLQHLEVVRRSVTFPTLSRTASDPCGWTASIPTSTNSITIGRF